MATDHVTNLKLGITQEEFLKNTEAHLEALYEENVTQGEAITAAQDKADEALAAAQGKTIAVSYATIADMVTTLKSMAKTAFKVGDTIYIVATDVPDFWVTAVNDTQNTSNGETALIQNNYGATDIGYFTISKLETQKVDLTKMVEADNNITDDQIVVGTGTRKVEGSGKKITTTAPSLSSDDTTVPTSKAVYDTVKSAVDNVHSHTNKTVLDNTTASYTAEEKEKLSKIDDSLLEVTADDIGKVKDVRVNGSTVLDENTGIANIVIDVKNLQGSYVDVTPTSNAITVNGTTYNAIVVANDTDVTLELLNSSGQAVVTQIVRKDNKLYYCLPSGDTNTYTLRKVGGNSVGGASRYLHKIHFKGVPNDGPYVNVSYLNTNNLEIFGRILLDVYSFVINDNPNPITSVETTLNSLWAYGDVTMVGEGDNPNRKASVNTIGVDAEGLLSVVGSVDEINVCCEIVDVEEGSGANISLVQNAFITHKTEGFILNLPNSVWKIHSDFVTPI